MSGRVCTECQKKIKFKSGKPHIWSKYFFLIELHKVSVSYYVVILWFYKMWYDFCRGLYPLKGFVPNPVEAERRPQDPQSSGLHFIKTLDSSMGTLHSLFKSLVIVSMPHWSWEPLNIIVFSPHIQSNRLNLLPWALNIFDCCVTF